MALEKYLYKKVLICFYLISALIANTFYAEDCIENLENSMLNNTHLVDIASVNPRILLDLRYATKNNFLGHAIYEKPLCFVHEKIAEALNALQQELETRGLGLKIYDAYRPLSAQQKMWDLIQDERYISNPAKNKGRHTRGTAVDLTLVNREGQELEMPSAFDDFTQKAHSDYQEVSKEARLNRQLLKEMMEKYGFIQFPFEWWHFDFQGWQNDRAYPPLDISFTELSR